MSPLVLLIAIAAVPFVLAFLLRVNAVFLFLSVAAGSLLAAQWGDSADSLIGGFTKYNHTDVAAHLILLLLPVLLTIFLLRKTLPTPLLPIQIIPLAATCASLAILVIAALPKDVQSDLYSGNIGTIVKNAQNDIVAGTAVVVLLLMWLTYRHRPAHGKKHKK